jgi:hypothetical protein
MISAAPLRVPFVVVCVLAAVPVLAQQPSAGQARAIREACRFDYMAACAGVPPGGEAALACLKQNAAKTSPKCQQALRKAAGRAPAAAAPSSAPLATTAQSAPAAWPHTVSGTNGTATIYEPQVISWTDRKTLNARIAIGITPTGAASPTFGVIEVAFTTQAELTDRTVVLTDPRLTSAKFPAADSVQAARFEERIRGALATMGVKQVALATIVLSLTSQGQKPEEVAIDNTPPRIFFSQQPASLVVFDGEPLLAPITGTTLSFAVNTNWDVFADSTTKTWYLLNNGGWLAAHDANGPWTPSSKLPPSFATLPSDPNFLAVKQQIPGRAFTGNTTPTIFVSTAPAAIIVTSGAPQYVRIAGTSLSYVANTDAALFRDSDGRFYYLVSGRWFSAPGLDGPWMFATPDLPPDFKRIPATGPRGFVLVSIPGSPQAEEALIEATIPQQSTLNRANAKLEVVYAGTPQFVAIPGTSMQYAVNTSFNVIQTSDGLFSCYQGAWFIAGSPTGPWTLAPSVPAIIYTIPPTNPMYPCTYVRVHASTPETVTYGYTSGYTMSYVSAGVVVYGTGYYYPPYVYPAPIPIYYPYPYSYAGATYYNATTGTWAQGGAIYGPYGGAAKAGYAYNPSTGAWAQGGAIYGPYGGAGSFSAYNPSTGSYAHGSAVWGPDGAAGNASWYNANTGRSVTTQQNANAYGRWGSSTINTPTQTIHTQSQSGAAGSAGSFTSSSGARGGAVSGAGGNTAGAVKTAGGNVYAGADGNVYKKTDSGWEKYDSGSWNPVQKPANTGTAQSSASRSTAQSTSARSGDFRSGAETGGRFEGLSQLEQDHNARMTGGARQQQFESMRGGLQGRGAARGGGFRR